MKTTCPTCGAVNSVEPDQVKLFLMTDDHMFIRVIAPTVENFVAKWRSVIEKYDGPSLCPIRICVDGKTIRNVGKIQHVDYKTNQPKDEAGVQAFIDAVNADPDLPTLISAAYEKEKA